MLLKEYRTDLYFQKYKIAVEVDEYGPFDRDNNYETQREEVLKKELGCALGKKRNNDR